MVSAPKPILEALAAVEERRRELAEAQRTHRQAQRAIAEGRARDNRAIAEARDAGKREPQRKHEAEAERAADAASRELEVCQERLRRASERVDRALEAGSGEWLAAVEAAGADADERASPPWRSSGPA